MAISAATDCEHRGCLTAAPTRASPRRAHRSPAARGRAHLIGEAGRQVEEAEGEAARRPLQIHRSPPSAGPRTARGGHRGAAAAPNSTSSLKRRCGTVGPTGRCAPNRPNALLHSAARLSSFFCTPPHFFFFWPFKAFFHCVTYQM